MILKRNCDEILKTLKIKIKVKNKNKSLLAYGI
jgi:hypothetical protein